MCNNFSASTQVEVEIIGIPVDCAKHKTRVIPRNSLNPIWNDVFTFQVSRISIHHENKSVLRTPPYTPLLNSKTGVYWGILFSYEAVLTCTHNQCFEPK